MPHRLHLFLAGIGTVATRPVPPPREWHPLLRTGAAIGLTIVMTAVGAFVGVKVGLAQADVRITALQDRQQAAAGERVRMQTAVAALQETTVTRSELQAYVTRVEIEPQLNAILRELDQMHQEMRARQ